MGAGAGRLRRASAAAGGVSLSRFRTALFRRAFAGAAAAACARICAPGARRLGAARRRGPLRVPQPLGQLPRALDRIDGAVGRRPAPRSGGDEHPVGEPPSADGLVLPAAARKAPAAHRAGRVSFRPVRRRLAGPLPRLSRCGAGKRRSAGDPARARRHRARADRERELSHRARVRHSRAGARRAGEGGVHRLRSRARRGQPPAGAARGRARFRRLVQLQIPECRPRRPRGSIRARAARGCRAATIRGLVGP